MNRSSRILLLSGDSPHPFPKPVKQPPLPPFPRVISFPTYYNQIPWPSGKCPQERDFLRMDAWGVEIPDLPMVPGASTEPNRSRTRVLTYLLDRWPRDWQKRILTAHAERSYTHFLLSEADSRFGPGQLSIQGLVDLCGLVKQYIRYVLMAIGSKVYNPQDQTPQQWADYAGPIMEALIAARVVDEFQIAWEWNLWNKPGQSTVDTFRWFGNMAHIGGCSCWAHYSSHVTSWQEDGTDRLSFYRLIDGYVDGVNYQAYPVICGYPWSPPRSGAAWDAGDFQARMQDTSLMFTHNGLQQKMRAMETTAIEQFTNEHPNEGEARTMGYLACCTPDIWGFGNGGSMPDGNPL